MIKRSDLSKYILFILIVFSINFTYSQAYVQFVENKNQWDNKVLFRADIPSGAMFMEKNCITFNMLRQADIHKCNHGHDEETHQHINDEKFIDAAVAAFLSLMAKYKRAPEN
ncbi:MAG: hypothetical protein ABIJ97_03510 [Bacteroidota bacterium]